MKKKPVSFPEGLKELQPYFEARLAEYFAKLPQPDPQYSVATVAEILDLTTGTVREYMQLGTQHPQHPRRLPYVDATGKARGRRIQLSEITAWQQRNRPDLLTLEIPVQRPARRRPERS
jgi:hypothetical protein